MPTCWISAKYGISGLELREWMEWEDSRVILFLWQKLLEFPFQIWYLLPTVPLETVGIAPGIIAGTLFLLQKLPPVFNIHGGLPGMLGEYRQGLPELRRGEVPGSFSPAKNNSIHFPTPSVIHSRTPAIKGILPKECWSWGSSAKYAVERHYCWSWGRGGSGRFFFRAEN